MIDIEELMSGSIDVQVLPDGRIVAKNNDRQIGMRLEPKTFY